MQDNVGFGWGFGIPAVVMILAIVVFFFGSPLYRYKMPHGSPLTSVFQVLVAAARKHKIKSDDDSLVLYEGPTEGQSPVEMLAHTNQFRYLSLQVQSIAFIFKTREYCFCYIFYYIFNFQMFIVVIAPQLIIGYP